jgi:membrane-anchored mycosin MYCP
VRVGGRRGPAARRTGALLVVVLLAASPAALGVGTAIAQPAAPVGPGPLGVLPASTPPTRDPAAVQTTACLVGTASTTPSILTRPWAQRQLAYEAAWKFGRGAGQVVAVIDTGVNPLPRLTVAPGGDYVAGTDGRTDCDGHGTIVASQIGARPAAPGDPGDPSGYAGVAPDATILSVRQYSALYETTTSQRPGTKGQPGDLSTLARSIVWAADRGATVINISEAACGAAGASLGSDDQVGAALRYVVDVKKVVVVAAAGNAEQSGDCKANPSDGVTPPVTAVSPAWWDDYVLAVGSVGEDGRPSPFTLAGPWVDVAAPGEGTVALNPVAGPALINQLAPAGNGAPGPIQGTSFATPYVAGTVALVRARFPDLTPRQVMARIEATAQAPAGGFDELVGHGVVDPVAAVTVLPAAIAPQGTGRTSSAFVVPPAPPTPSSTPRTVAVIGSAAALGTVLVTFAVLNAVQRSRRQRG